MLICVTGILQLQNDEDDDDDHVNAGKYIKTL